MPRLCSAERLSESMSMKYFRRGLHEYRNENGAGVSGGGAVGAYQAGVVKALAEVVHRSAWFQGPALAHSMVPFRGLSRSVRSCRTPGGALGSLGNNQVLSVNRLVYFSLLKKCSRQ